MVEATQLITAIATLIFAIGAFVVGWRNSRQIEQVHIATNSLTDRLVQTTKTEAFAAGVKNEKERTGEDTRGA